MHRLLIASAFVLSVSGIAVAKETFSRLLDIDPVAALAVWYVESGGRAFTPGSPVLRFENHKFFKYWGVDHESVFDKRFQFGGHAGIPGASHKNHKFRVKPSDPWRPVHIDSQDREYETFALGERLGGREAACLSSSFGGPQIMGFNHPVCGYASATALAEAFGADQRWQVLGFYDFCRANNLIDEIRNKQWNRFGEIYNGNGAVYGPLLKRAFDTKGALLALPKIPNPPIEMAVMAAARKAAPKPKRAARRSKRVAAKTRRSTKPKRAKRAQRAVAKPKKSRRRAA